MKICTYFYSLLKAVFCCIIKLPWRCATSPCGMCRTALNRRFVVLYLVTFFFILPGMFSNVRYSAFYSVGNATQAVERFTKENTQRIELADEYFRSVNQSGQSVLTGYGDTVTDEDGKSAVNVALTIITVSRNRHSIDAYEPRYLSQVVWKYLVLMHEERRKLIENDKHPKSSAGRRLHVQMSVCNVDRDPASYHEARKIARHVPSFRRFRVPYFPTEIVLEKEKQDYVFCLNRSLDNKPDYVFLVEDDALPTDDVFQVLDHVIHMHVENGRERGDIVRRSEKLAYVKFYHPERLLNFISFERERLSELFAYVSLLSLTLTGLYLFCFKLDPAVTVYRLWRLMAVFSLLVFLSIGRTGMSEWRRFASPALYIYTPAPSCCTPAMLFPRAAASLVVNFLNASVCDRTVGKDTLLDRMIAEHHMSAYLVQPNTFTHIGMYSSLRDRLVDPFMV